MRYKQVKFKRWLRLLMVAAVAVLQWWPAIPVANAATDSWTTSLHDVQRTAASTDTTIGTANAANLTQKWSFATGGPVASTPTINGGVAYFGSWDGYEYAVDATTGALKWKTFLGITTANPICIPPSLGVSSPATVANGVVYVGGGDQYWYALDATTGNVLWKVLTGNVTGSYDGHYNWSGPLIYNGFAYVGIASVGDCPLVQGQLLKINLTTHNVDNTLNIVPNGQVGGGIWTSPALDPATNTIYTATGTENSPTQTYAQAFLAIDAGTLAIKDHWKLPESEAVLDSDFSTSTTLFTDAQGRQLVTSINKNGWAYTFVRTNLAGGPIWKQQIAQGGECPTCGQSSVSSGAFGGGRIYLAGNSGVINGQGFPGTIRALDPATGAYIWQHPSSGSVIGALAYANGLVFAGAGNVVEVLNASTGNTLYSFDTGAQIYAGPSIANGMVYVGNTAGKVLAFGLGTPITPPADANCPSGFTCQDVGNSLPAGSEGVTSGNWTVNAGGGGLGGTADSLRIMTKPSAGNTQVMAQVTGLPTGLANAQGGVILRQSNLPGAPFFAVIAKPNSLVVQSRTTFGGTVNIVNSVSRPALPLYLMIQRINNTLTASTSTNGTNFTLVPGATVTMVMPAASLAGLATSSGTNGTTGKFTLAHVAVGAPSVTPVPTPPATACPAGWNCADVGDPALVGDQSLASGTWTVKGAGGDIWANSDQFHYVWQTIAADGTVSARVTTQTNTDANAKAGVMLRGSTAADSAYYAAYTSPDGNIHVQFRDTNGLTAEESARAAGAVPQYLEVARSGTSFTAYTSPDGTNWTPITSSTVSIPNLSGTIDAGIAVNSHNTTTMGTATFTNVAVGAGAPPPPNLCPSGWTCQDIGFPTPAGQQSLSNGTWNVEAGGGDIWDTYDSFRLISQNLNGDGSVSAHLVSQTNTGPWAKAGTMLRLSNDPQAPYYAVFGTPSNGVAVQWRTAQAGTTQQVDVAGTVPVYLKVTRTGASFTAYTSTNGTTWNAIAGSTQTIGALSGTLLGGMAADSYNTAAINTTVWDTVNVTGSGGGGLLPSPWVDGDVGAPALAGSASYANNTFTVKGGGNDIWGTTDQFNYVSQPLNGDGQIVARVTSQTNTDPWAKAGVMIKQSTTAGSPYVAAMVTPGNGVHFQANFNTDQAGGSYTFPNAWLKLVRSGNLFTAYSSPDGSNWVQAGQITLSVATNATVGLFDCSHNGTALSTVTFDNVSVTATGGGSLPSPWVNGDIGTPMLPGSSSYSSGTFFVKGSGDDIWGTADDFQFASQPLTGDGQIVARVTAQDNTDPWAKSGVMIKSSLTAGAPYSAIMVTPGNGLHMQSNFNSDVSGGAFAFPNAWLKLVRSGSTVTTYASSDGNTWTQVGTATVSLPATAQIGLFVCSHNNTAINTTTFDNVSVTAAGGALPSGWADTDVGAPATAGSASFNNGVFSVKGAGTDVWGTADQMHYAYKSLSGNGSITARVTAQSSTDPWAKSGVMIKQSTTAGTTYAAAMVTPGNGVRLQSNFNSDQAGGTPALPVWLRLTRNGNTVTAFSSTDGTTWTQIGAPVTLTLSDPVTVGLFVCSHNWSALNTTTFDNVTTTP